eukprot:1018383-Amphidinium_carterae.1
MTSSHACEVGVELSCLPENCILFSHHVDGGEGIAPMSSLAYDRDMPAICYNPDLVNYVCQQA